MDRLLGLLVIWGFSVSVFLGFRTQVLGLLVIQIGLIYVDVISGFEPRYSVYL